MSEQTPTLTAPPRVKPPRPESLRAMLVSVAIEEPTFTLHRFIQTIPGTFKGPLLSTDKAPDRRCWFFEYECTETGFRRVFGCVDRHIDVPETHVLYDDDAAASEPSDTNDPITDPSDQGGN